MQLQEAGSHETLRGASEETAVQRPQGFAAAERAVRQDLAAAYRLVAYFGMDDSIYTHISARVPGTTDQFLINPYGMLFRDITASSLVKIDLEGRILDDSPYDVNPAGFTIHSAIHSARHDAACVLHTHTVAGVAVSSLASGLRPCNQWALQFYNRVVYHDFEGIALDADEKVRLVEDLGPTARVLILRNHGLVTLGRTIPEAVILMLNLERACKVQVAIESTNQAVHPVPPEICEKTARQYDRWGRAQDGQSGGAGPGAPAANGVDPYLREWQALLQRIEPLPATSFRD